MIQENKDNLFGLITKKGAIPTLLAIIFELAGFIFVLINFYKTGTILSVIGIMFLSYSLINLIFKIEND